MKAVLFDLDGTLIDSAEDIALALKNTLQEIGMSQKMPADVRALVGGGVKALLEKVLGEDFREDYVSIFRKHYIANPVVHTKPYEGVVDTLTALRKEGVATAVVTNKLEELSLKILKELGLFDLFDLVVGGDTYPEKKPSPLPVKKALERIGVSPSQALMVGDTWADIESGRRAGTKTALATWGYVRIGSEEPDYRLDKPEDILSLAFQVSGA